MSAESPAVKAPLPLTLRQHLEGPAFIDAVKKALPRHLTPDRFIRVALTAITKTPKLAQCDQASFFSALLTLSQFGLEPDGRRAHLIPFENRKRGVVECQLIIDWKGLAELAMRSGIVSTLHADVVRAGDTFVYSMGVLENHIPFFLRTDASKPGDAGEIIAAYATAQMKDGGRKTEVLSIGEVNAIRARSRAGQSGPWVTDYAEMAKKTAFRRLSKWLPLSPEFRDAVEVESDIELAPINVTTVNDRLADGLAAMIEAGAPADSDAGEHEPVKAEVSA
jgi:recombination protein RecT